MKTGKPRSGSMQFWPRKRAKKETPRVRSWAKSDEPSILGFAGYKAGMTHILFTDNRPNSKTKGEEVSFPVTVIECPPIKIASIRLYKKTSYGLKLNNEIHLKTDKELKKRKTIPKNQGNIDEIKPEDFDELRVNIYTQPKLTGIGKKKPEVFETALGGSKEDQLNFIKSNIDKEIKIQDILKPGQQLDTVAITKGKGFQGPVKRFGIGLRSHKSEKTIRGPGSLGGWCGQGHFMYRIAHAGKMGYHTRTEYNKQMLAIIEDPKEVNPKGGFVNYGIVKNTSILIKGSIQGPKKRLIRLVYARRPNKLIHNEAPSINFISLDNAQGR